jgi:hypothetical protein
LPYAGECLGMIYRLVDIVAAVTRRQVIELRTKRYGSLAGVTDMRRLG